MRLAHRATIPGWTRPFQRIEYLLALLLTLSLYGEAFPYGAPLFFPLVALAVGWFGFIKRKLALPTNGGFALAVLCFAFYLCGMVQTSYLYDTNARDLRNGLGLLLLSLLLYSLRDSEDFQNFSHKAQVFGAVTSVSLAIGGLYKFHLMASGETIAHIWIEGRPYPWGTSLIVDYNFYAFAMLAGAISCLFCLRRLSSFTAKVMSLSGFCLTTISMSLSGSRRGWVTEAGLLAITAVLALFWFGATILRGSSLKWKHTVETMAAVLLLVMLTPILLQKYRPAFLESNRGDFQAQLQDLRHRLETLSDPAQSFEGRSGRWKFSSQLLNTAPAIKFIFGQGFDYLHRFPSQFGTVGGEDYPHNPVISAALYSGIVGSLAVLLLMILAFFYYIRHRKTDLYFVSLYFASLWFVLPSFDSIFSGKFFGFLLLIPWSLAKVTNHDSHVTCAGNRFEFVYTRLSSSAPTEYAFRAGV